MIGGLLQDKRLSKGIDLERIAHDLKIRISYLKALEEENFDIFPADVYTMGYIRSYAIYLGIEPEPLIEEFKALRQKQKASHEIIPETLETDKIKSRNSKEDVIRTKSNSWSLSFKPNFLILVVIILIGGIATFSIFKTTRQQKDFTLPAPPASQTSQKISNSGVNIFNPSHPSSQPAKPQAQAVTLPPAPENKTFNGPYTLKIVASELCWLLVESEEGSHDITIKPGEAVQYTSKKGFKIKTGNAGGIKLFLNGKDMGSPGKSGEVKIINLP